jgi:hypothetical protein
VASFSFVPGFKTRLWRTLPPELTASYQYVWLRDSDVITTPSFGAADATSVIVSISHLRAAHAGFSPVGCDVRVATRCEALQAPTAHCNAPR